jgi:hypothetical protein
VWGRLAGAAARAAARQRRHSRPLGSCQPGEGSVLLIFSPTTVNASVGDPDPHVFGPPESGGLEVRIRIFPFSHNGVVWTEKMLAK